ncbi:hypothetical protein BC829DRAFT_405841 [Chytridium lagenaria]|nr:hypothetical protein BC829DRAFT_405841 [Chytridium lagenaria]
MFSSIVRRTVSTSAPIRASSVSPAIMSSTTATIRPVGNAPTASGGANVSFAKKATVVLSAAITLGVAAEIVSEIK